MLTNQLKSNTQLTNKESWHFEIVVTNVETNFVSISVNQNPVVMNPYVVKMNKGIKGVVR